MSCEEAGGCLFHECKYYAAERRIFREKHFHKRGGSMRKLVFALVISITLTSLALGDFERTTGLIDIPAARVLPGGTYRVALTGVFAIGRDLDSPADFNSAFGYGVRDWGEITLSMLTTVDYAFGFNCVFLEESGSVPSLGFGIHNITYRKYISELGNSGDFGYSDDVDYKTVARRPHEQFSIYFVATKDMGGFGEHTIGFGRGKYVGFGPHSHWFNTDMLFASTKQSELLGKAHEDAIGLFFGSSWRIIESLSVMLEFDGRDVNSGITYKFPMFDLNLAWTHMEQIGKTHRPRVSFGASVFSHRPQKVTKFSHISLRVYDNETKEALSFNVNLEKEKQSKTYEGKAGKITMRVLPGEYEMKVIIPGYKWKKIKFALKEGETRAFKLGVDRKPSEEELGKEKEFDSNFIKGVTCHNNGNYRDALAYLEQCLVLKPGEEEASIYYERAKEAFDHQCNELRIAAEVLEKKRDYKGALNKYQELLLLIPNDEDVKSKVNEMTRELTKKKKEVAPSKPSEQEIQNWYREGLGQFSSGNYKEAIALFEKVLRYDPGNSGAEKYLNKARTRLKAMGE
jgi:tetratricopeptide (TPR) repeat protein